jgi:hypothetical protein
MGVDMGVPPFSGSLYFSVWWFCLFFSPFWLFLFPTEFTIDRYLVIVLHDAMQSCLFIALNILFLWPSRLRRKAPQFTDSYCILPMSSWLICTLVLFFRV